MSTGYIVTLSTITGSRNENSTLRAVYGTNDDGDVYVFKERTEELYILDANIL